MSALRASEELAEKTNVNPSVNRQKEATAEDFREIAQIFEHHANRLDELQNELYHADFVGYFGSLSLLQATYPNAPENAFAIIVNGSNIPQQIYRWENDEWTLIFGTDALVSYNTKSQFPLQGVTDKLYFARDSMKLYLWYNSQYLCINEKESLFYDQLDFILTDVIANASNQFSGANFYIIEADQESTPYHFAVKNSLAGRFTDFAIQIINASGQRQDLKGFDFEYNGYKIWKLPNITNYSDLQNNPFQVWFYNDSSIRYDIEQDLTPPQQQQAQENIGLISDEIPDWTSEAENEINF
ncbi:hypothetical protein [Mesonia aestuariivivens]|uniref:Uncharacterized protein n=1 Tax=Mesonia aestuariivivens TaxID=2796128 RepID=A0ABS6W380_9FLAO|nr:hypothetical protein [Mesonia aestuariivivens]MBW2962315.1 hypothetical protein [Mesonia aestuariivivens]